jgi:Zn-dependent protease
MDFLSLAKIQEIVLFIPLFIICLSIHEFAHAWAAQKLGDPTAKYLGRLTMDPMAHISLLGTVVFPIVGLLMGGILFGWANPVPVDPRHFKKPRQGMALVAAAGPASNVIMAVLFAAALGLATRFVPVQEFRAESGMWPAFLKLVQMAVVLNLFLAFFNLIPLPPLDGSRILAGLVSERTASKIDQLEQMSFWIFLILLMTGVLRFVSIPVYLLGDFLLTTFT